MTDFEEIYNIMSRYCRAIDDRLVDDLAAILTDDFSFVVPPNVFQGKSTMLDRIRNSPRAPGRHLTANPAIVVNGDAAHAESDWVQFDGTLTLRNMGRYSDDYRREDGVWRLAVRSISLYGSSEG